MVLEKVRKIPHVIHPSLQGPALVIEFSHSFPVKGYRRHHGIWKFQKQRTPTSRSRFYHSVLVPTLKKTLMVSVITISQVHRSTTTYLYMKIYHYNSFSEMRYFVCLIFLDPLTDLYIFRWSELPLLSLLSSFDI